MRKKNLVIVILIEGLRKGVGVLKIVDVLEK